MDAVDVRIFCEMAFYALSYGTPAERRISPAEIGKKLRLDEKTVRVRVKKMEGSGFIKYYQAMPNLALFGLRSIGSFRFEALNLSTKFALIDGIHRVRGIVDVSDYLGPYVSADIAGESPTVVQKTAKSMADQYELSMTSLGSRVVREPLSRFDRLDWRVIQKLRFHAWSETNEIASAVSATPRMVSYRISKVLDSGGVSIRAVIDAKKQQGVIFYELEVAIDPPRHSAVVQTLKERFGESLWSMKNPSPDVVIMGLFGFSLGEPESSVVRVLGTDGVRRCSLFILKEVLEPGRPNWVDELIANEIEVEHGPTEGLGKARRS